MQLDEMRENLRIGFGAKFKSEFPGLLAQIVEIFDDAIVDDGEAAVLGKVRVGILHGRNAVGRPSGMADSDRAFEFERMACDCLIQVCDFADGLSDGDIRFRRGSDCDTGRIVAAILEFTET